MRKVFAIVLIMTTVNTITCYAQQVNEELNILVCEANIEMGHSMEQIDRLFTGETRDLIKKNHLKIRNDSVIYACIIRKDYVKMLNEVEDLREQQMVVFMHIELNPKFNLLVEYLIENDLSLYQIFQSIDAEVHTKILEYNSDLLKKFGSLAVK